MEIVNLRAKFPCKFGVGRRARRNLWIYGAGGEGGMLGLGEDCKEGGELWVLGDGKEGGNLWVLGKV